MIQLFSNYSDCCACGSCLNVCPRKAITMTQNSEGFIYPHIDKDLCVECGACLRVCDYKSEKGWFSPQKVYAAASKDDGLIMQSASGGVFSTIANQFIVNGGLVFGAAMMCEDNELIVKHIGISSLDKLHLLLGSKYVQSHIELCFQEIKRELNAGRRVLFSGTPCQCAGLRSFLKSNYDNLFIVDIICHGVPNQKFFNDYLKANFGNLKKIYNFKFRDKTRGWEMTARLDYQGGSKLIPGRTSSYFSFFLDGQTYRENCYYCKYARKERVGDVTIGDYWGVQKEHPEFFEKKIFSSQKGISCILVNTETGCKLINESANLFVLRESTFSKVSRRNEQLNIPSKKGIYRNKIMKLYSEYGYSKVEMFYRRIFWKQIIVHLIFNKMPYFVKEIIRKHK